MKTMIMVAIIMATILATSATRHTYIVRVSASHQSTQPSHVLYRYETVFDGFSATLSSREADALSKEPGVISVSKDRVYRADTTRSPGFLGISSAGGWDSVHPKKPTDQLVIGILDTGVWPEHPSFDDSRLGPVPASWKGSCEEGDDFKASSCNRKLIGARYFYKGYAQSYGLPERISARDYEGHGTHTSSTAAGSLVQNASLFGLAKGEARGMAPDARIAAYKVCWGSGGCIGSDILAAMEAAIRDGVDVISMSIGAEITEYSDDPTAIGAYSAVTKGIFVACSAGNSGPGRSSVENVAPWITTVGASSLDREFWTNVTLGNGETYTGVSLWNDEPVMKSPAPLVYIGECNTHDPKLVKGKIVVCDQDGDFTPASTSMKVKAAGGVGVIHINTRGEEIHPASFFLPSAAMGKEAGNAIKVYMDSDPTAKAVISPATTKLGVKPAPAMASFSSRGPNGITPEILKPDLTAPGVTIIAAWTAATGPAYDADFDMRKVRFNIVSGTSMSCPHVSGLALLLKAAHPEWSPAIIRSALMTTAYTSYGHDHRAPIIDRATERPATPLDYGSGHVDPMAALDPGLVYDATEDDYLGFLCAIRYTSSQIKKVTNKDFTCDPRKEYKLGDFNYPSFSVVLRRSSSNTTTYTRTVTNVGGPSTYTVSVFMENDVVNATVEPSTLTFTQVNQKNTYSITFVTSKPHLVGTIFGSLEWSDGKHKVRSPIVVSSAEKHVNISFLMLLLVAYLVCKVLLLRVEEILEVI